MEPLRPPFKYLNVCCHEIWNSKSDAMSVKKKQSYNSLTSSGARFSAPKLYHPIDCFKLVVYNRLVFMKPMAIKHLCQAPPVMNYGCRRMQACGETQGRIGQGCSGVWMSKQTLQVRQSRTLGSNRALASLLSLVERHRSYTQRRVHWLDNTAHSLLTPPQNLHVVYIFMQMIQFYTLHQMLKTFDGLMFTINWTTESHRTQAFRYLDGWQCNF